DVPFTVQVLDEEGNAAGGAEVWVWEHRWHAPDPAYTLLASGTADSEGVFSGSYKMPKGFRGRGFYAMAQRDGQAGVVLRHQAAEDASPPAVWEISLASTEKVRARVVGRNGAPVA